MPQINPQMNEVLNDLVAYMFYLNRVWDAGMSKLNVDFVMSNFEASFHGTVAHKFPIIADKISEIQTAFNNITTYKLTPQGKNNYAKPLEFFEFVLAETLKGQKLIAKAIEFAGSQEDPTGTNAAICTALSRLQRYFVVHVAQAILLCDKSKAYGQEPFQLMMFDEAAGGFMITPADIPSLID